MARVTREKELLKKQLEAKVASLQTQVQTHKDKLAVAEEQSEQTEQAALEKSRLDEEYAVKVAELEFQLDEMQKKVADGEARLQTLKD